LKKYALSTVGLPILIKVTNDNEYIFFNISKHILEELFLKNNLTKFCYIINIIVFDGNPDMRLRHRHKAVPDREKAKVGLPQSLHINSSIYFRFLQGGVSSAAYIRSSEWQNYS
jgi:hypothetical protein